MTTHFLILLILSATSPTKTLNTARRLYEQGKYQNALPLFDELDRETLPEAQEKESKKLHAFSVYMLGLHDDAKRLWLRLLDKYPDYRLDPNLDSPVFVSYFEGVRREREQALNPPPPPIVTPPAPKGRPCGIALCLVPFGVGQFVNRRPVKGTVFAVLEVGLLATNLGLQFKRDADFSRLQTFDERADERAVIVQNVAFGLFVATLIYGVVDAFVFP